MIPVPKFPKITCAWHKKGRLWRTGRHEGVDFGSAGVNGAEIVAPYSGTITGASWGSAYGNHVIIDFDKLPDGSAGLWGVLAHMSKVVKKSGKVKKGELIGYVGATGNVTGAHLHFEVQPQAHWVKGSSVNPQKWLDA